MTISWAVQVVEEDEIEAPAEGRSRNLTSCNSLRIHMLRISQVGRAAATEQPGLEGRAISGYITGMMDARTKAVKSHRRRLRKRRMRRVEVTVGENDAALVRQIAAALRRDDASARQLRTMVCEAGAPKPEPSVLDIFNSLPDISGPEFDAVFEEIERFRHHPTMMQVRDVEP